MTEHQATATHNGRVLAKMIADSASPYGVRISTIEVTLPRIVLAEMNTHTVISKNSASSRAIPVQRMLRMVEEDPYIPETWGRNRNGMQATEALSEDESQQAEWEWLQARDEAVNRAKGLLAIGVHKQTTNRLLEPWLWHKCLLTATEWDNFLNLRCHKDAHPAIQNTAICVRRLLEDHEPTVIKFGEWHTPYIVSPDDDSLSETDRIKVSAARCARISYLTHDGKRDHAKDIELHDMLLASGHMSPFAHQAKCTTVYLHSNFRRPWLQYRKTIPYEWDVLGHSQKELR